ncbi:hypothetical protein LWI28_000238 [Acer negundo]|uniref:RRM domain-containing protein n=1 Tax=Acer negundo TaxID=4023 RepID=A0AAD5IH08_ACENE|nr:hypothetical protein LWI28_000238 [Acer negundo]
MENSTFQTFQQPSTSSTKKKNSKVESEKEEEEEEDENGEFESSLKIKGKKSFKVDVKIDMLINDGKVDAKKAEVNGYKRRKYFRENLVSIFVDNLHFKVDTMCIWRIFKPFGKVKDVYLIGVNENIKKGYASLRFGTIKEAKKVAGLTHGIHVYGWLISVKMAEYGWNRRRSPRQSKWDRTVVVGTRRAAVREVSRHQWRKEETLSYVEVVKINNEKITTSKEEKKGNKKEARTPELVALHENLPMSPSTLFNFNGDKKRAGSRVNENLLRYNLDFESDVRRKVNKGKALYVRNSKKRPPMKAYLNSKFIIQKKGLAKNKGGLYKRDSTSSDSEVELGGYPRCEIFKGEC